jgi:hypothetical protein
MAKLPSVSARMVTGREATGSQTPSETTVWPVARGHPRLPADHTTSSQAVVGSSSTEYCMAIVSVAVQGQNLGKTLHGRTTG